MQNYFDYRAQRPKEGNADVANNEEVKWSQGGQKHRLKSRKLMSEGPKCVKVNKTSRSTRSAPKLTSSDDNSEVAQKKEKNIDCRLRQIRRKLGTEVMWLQYYKRIAEGRQKRPTGSTSGFISTSGTAPRRLATGRAT